MEESAIRVRAGERAARIGGTADPARPGGQHDAGSLKKR